MYLRLSLRLCHLSLVYLVLGAIWKAEETMIEQAIKPEGVYDAENSD